MCFDLLVVILNMKCTRDCAPIPGLMLFQLSFCFLLVKQVTHWRSPRFHGYHAAGGSYPYILGDILCDAIGCIGFSWVSFPCSPPVPTRQIHFLLLFSSTKGDLINPVSDRPVQRVTYSRINLCVETSCYDI